MPKFDLRLLQTKLIANTNLPTPPDGTGEAEPLPARHGDSSPRHGELPPPRARPAKPRNPPPPPPHRALRPRRRT
ncbi:MAG TPA: hypothetical protein VIV40_17665 [Kofleriaceae bacterium]